MVDTSCMWLCDAAERNRHQDDFLFQSQNHPKGVPISSLKIEYNQFWLCCIHTSCKPAQSLLWSSVINTSLSSRLIASMFVYNSLVIVKFLDHATNFKTQVIQHMI